MRRIVFKNTLQDIEELVFSFVGKLNDEKTRSEILLKCCEQFKKMFPNHVDPDGRINDRIIIKLW